jgi:hypothetical protein
LPFCACLTRAERLVFASKMLAVMVEDFAMVAKLA